MGSDDSGDFDFNPKNAGRRNRVKARKMRPKNMAQNARREHHNALERARRKQLGIRYMTLMESIPEAAKAPKMPSRQETLIMAMAYINNMKNKILCCENEVTDVKRQNMKLDEQISHLIRTRDERKESNRFAQDDSYPLNIHDGMESVSDGEYDNEPVSDGNYVSEPASRLRKTRDNLEKNDCSARDDSYPLNIRDSFEPVSDGEYDNEPVSDGNYVSEPASRLRLTRENLEKSDCFARDDSYPLNIHDRMESVSDGEYHQSIFGENCDIEPVSVDSKDDNWSFMWPPPSHEASAYFSSPYR